MQIISFDTSNKAVLKNAGLGFFFQFLIRFKGIITLPIIVHYLSKNDLGIVLIIGTTTSLIIPLISLNLFDGSGMFFSSDLNNESVTYKYSTILCSASLILLILIIPVAIVLHYLSVTKLYWVLITIYIFISVVFKSAIMLYETYQKSKLLVVVNFIVSYGSAILTILALMWYRNYLSILVPTYLLNFLVSIFLFKRIYKEIKFKIYIDKLFLKKVLKISIPLIPVYITEWLLGSVGVYMLSYFGQLDEVGSFSVLISVAGIFLILRTTLQFFWFSTCSNLLQGKKTMEFNAIYQLVIKGYIYLIISGIILYIFLINDILSLLTSKEYLFLEIPVLITVAGYSFMIFSSIYNGILYALAHSKEILISYIISAISVVFVGFLLIPEYRILGAALSLVIGNIILQLMLQFFCYKLKILQKIDNIFFVILISIIFVSISYYLSQLKIDQFLIRGIGICVLSLYTIIIIKLKYLPIEKVYSLLKMYVINKFKLR